MTAFPARMHPHARRVTHGFHNSGRVVRGFRTLMLAALCATPLAAQSVAPPPASSSSSITAEELRHHVGFLAADSLEGRGTGTVAIDVAAEYIAREFKRYGLEPAGENGTYFQIFDVVTGVTLGTNNALKLLAKGAGLTYAVGTDFTPYGFSKSGSVRGDVVFAGWGIRAATLGRDDYAGIDARDKIVLVLAGNPDGDDPHSPLTAVTGTRSKAMFAREAGAKALLVVRLDLDALPAFRYDNSPTDAGLPVVGVRHAVAKALLGPAGITLPAEGDTAAAAAVRTQVLDGTQIELVTDLAFTRKKARNVMGMAPGRDDVMRDTVIVVGAHFDHLGLGQEGSLHKGEPMVHNGADDNASGTAGMLELAQRIGEHPMRHSVLFQAYSAEEMGLLGSNHWVNHPTVPLARISAMLNLDMIGRLPDSTRKLNVQGTGSSPIWNDLVKSVNEHYAFDLAMIPDGQGSSDQASFYMKDIPVLFFFTGLHTDYHRPSDDVEKLNIDGQVRVTQFVSDILTGLDRSDAKLAFTKVAVPENRRMSAFRVYVGTIPDYSATEEGFKISGTSPGGPAEKAGMKAGDVIVRFGETDVRNIYDYMNALSLYKPGDDVAVNVKRGSETVTLTVHLTKK